MHIFYEKATIRSTYMILFLVFPQGDNFIRAEVTIENRNKPKIFKKHTPRMCLSVRARERAERGRRREWRQSGLPHLREAVFFCPSPPF